MNISNILSIYEKEIFPIICEDIKKFDRNYLIEIFREFIQKIIFIENLSIELKEYSYSIETPNTETLIIKIRTFALHYLSVGARIPILCESEKGHRSPLDYMTDADNQALYYRGDGSSIHQKFLSVFFSQNITINTTNKYQTGVIKPSQFTRLMKKACKSCLYREKEIEDFQKNMQKEKTFFNITGWIEAELHRDLSNISQLITQAQIVADQLPDSSVLGGVFQENAYVGVFIFFTNQKPIHLGKERALTTCLIEDLLNLRGNIGAFPEMIEIKSALAKKRYPFREIGQRSSNNNSIDRCPFLTQLQQLIIYLSNNKKEGSLSIYVTIITNLLQAFQNKEKYYFVDTSDSSANVKIQQRLSYSLKIIRTQFDSMTNEFSFYDNLQKVYLAFEEVIFLSLFFEPNEVNSLEKILKKLFDSDLRDDVTLFELNSGMTCYDVIIETIHTHTTTKPRLGIVRGSYYELAEDLKQYLKKEWHIEMIDPKSSDMLNADLLLLDLYPNDVTLKEMKSNPVEFLINQALQHRTPQTPLTVVLDISTTLFSNPEILRLKQTFNAEIISGKLNLIVTGSLAKFYSCGLDKYTGGVIGIFGSPNATKFRKSIIQEIKILKIKDVMSKEAQRFFSLFFTYALKDIEVFYETIKNNTQLIYTEMQHQQSGKELLIREKDFTIPMIGLYTSLTKNLEEEELRDYYTNLQFYLYKKARQLNLPLLIRASFPFPHTAVIECFTALRISIGLDAPELKKQYLTLFQSVSQKLKENNKFDLEKIKLSLKQTKSKYSLST